MVNEATPPHKLVGAFLLKNFLPISYTVVIIVGCVVPEPGVFLDHEATKYVCVVSIFVISGLYLKTDEMKEVLVSCKGAIFGIVSILAITPGIGGALTLALNFNQIGLNSSQLSNNISENVTGTYSDGPLGPIEYKYGIMIFLIMPCTVSSGIVMITQLNGHLALGLFLTVTTNVFGIFVIPLHLRWTIANTLKVNLDATTLVWKLVVSLFLPLCVGKLVRVNKRVQVFVAKWKPIFKVLSVTCLDVAIWVKVSSASKDGFLRRLAVTNVLFLIAWPLAIHSVFLLANFLGTSILKLSYAQQKAVVILASQKSLVVGIAVVGCLPRALGDPGIMVVAMIFFHLTVLIYDSLLVSFVVHYDERKQELADGKVKEFIKEDFKGDPDKDLYMLVRIYKWMHSYNQS